MTMWCLPFLCSSRDATAATDDPALTKPIKQPPHHKPNSTRTTRHHLDPSHVPRSPDVVIHSASSASPSPILDSHQPSHDAPLSPTRTAGDGSLAWSKSGAASAARQHVEADECGGVELAERDEAIKQAFSTPVVSSRQLFPSSDPPAVLASSPLSDESTSSACSSSTSPSSTSASTASHVVSPLAAAAALPPPHPGTHARRQSMPLAQPQHPLPPAIPARSTPQSHSRCMSSAPHASPPFLPTASPPLPARASLSQPPSPFSSASSASQSRTPKAQSTPLRARRLQRHRALSQSSPHSALFPRSTHIGSSSHLSSFFASSAALGLMRDRLTRGLIALHHQPGDEPRYKHIYCSASLTRLHYVDLPASWHAIGQHTADSLKQPHILASSLSRVTKGLSTKSLIQRQSELGDGAALEGSLLLSLCSPTLTLDLECVSESERDEWWLTFDFLLNHWNTWRRQHSDATLSPLSSQPLHPPSLPPQPKGRRGSWLGAVVGLYEQHDRLARQSQQAAHGGDELPPVILRSPDSAAGRRLSGSASIASTTSPCSGRSVLSEYELYSVMGRYVSDIEAVREANRLLLVDDCAAMIDMQNKLDAIRLDNARLIDELAPADEW